MSPCRYVYGKFAPIRQITVGTDFLTKKVQVLEANVVLQLWDTAGLERFHQGSLGNGFYRGASGCVLVYDVNDVHSLENISMWNDEVLSKIGTHGSFPVVVVGNKVDLKSEDNSRVMEWCREHGYGHREASAKDNIGVEEAMMAIASLALANRHDSKVSTASVESAARGNNVNLGEMYAPRKGGLCGCSGH